MITKAVVVVVIGLMIGFAMAYTITDIIRGGALR